MGERLVIAYHGTTKKNTTAIKRDGFKAWTYFARDLEDALFYGGEYIFEVVFPEEVVNNWQFRIENWLHSKSIVAHYRLKITKYYDNDALRERIEQSNARM